MSWLNIIDMQRPWRPRFSALGTCWARVFQICCTALLGLAEEPLNFWRNVAPIHIPSGGGRSVWIPPFYAVSRKTSWNSVQGGMLNYSLASVSHPMLRALYTCPKDLWWREQWTWGMLNPRSWKGNVEPGPLHESHKVTPWWGHL